MKRLLKISALSLAALIILLLVLLGALQTPWVKTLIVDKTESALSDALGAHVSIGRLSGVLPWTLNLRDLTLEVKGDDRLLHIDKVEAGVQPFAALFNTIRITKLHIDHLDVALREQKDGTWNFQPLIEKLSGGEPKEKKPAEKSAGFGVEIGDVRLTGGRVRVANEKLPQKEPLEVALALEGSFENGSLSLENLLIQSKDSLITASGKTSPSAPPDFKAHIDVKDLAGVTRYFMDPPMRGAIQGDMRLTALEPVPILDGKLTVTDFSGAGIDLRTLDLTMRGDTPSRKSEVVVEGSGLTYNDVVIREIKLTAGLTPEVLTLQASASGEPEARLSFSGKVEGIADPKKEITVSELRVGMKNSFWNAADPIRVTYRPEGVDIHSLTLARNDQKISLSGSAAFEGANDLTVDIENIDVGDNLRLFQVADDVEGVFSTRARLTGTAAKPLIQGKTEITGLKWEDLKLDLATLNFDYADEKMSLACLAKAPDGNELHVEGKVPLRLSAEGGGPLLPSKGLDLTVDGRDLDLAMLKTFIPQLKVVKARADLAARLTGNPTDPEINGELELRGDRLEFRDVPYPYALKKLRARAVFNRDEIDLQDLGFNAGEHGSVSLNGAARLEHFKPRTFNFSLRADRLPTPPSEGYEFELSADLNGQGSLDKMALGGSLQIAGVAHDYLWKTEKPIAVALEQGDLHIESFTLVNGDQRLDVAGAISVEHNNDLTVKLRKIGLLSNLRFLGITDAPEGYVSADLRLTGEGLAPHIEGQIDVNKVKYADAPVLGTHLEIRYEDKSLDLTGKVTSEDGNTLTIKGTAPINLALKTNEPRLGRSGLDLSVQGRNLNLAVLKDLAPQIREAQANADIDLNVTGDPLDPAIQGRLSVDGKKIDAQGLPAPITDLEARARFTQHKVEIEKLDFSMGKQGNVSASGYANLEEFQPREFDFSLKALKVPVGSYQEKHGVVDADLKASGTMENAKLTGTLALSELETGARWRTIKPIDVEAQKERIAINSFDLANRNQAIDVSGVISFTESSDLTLNIKNVEIEPLLSLTGAAEEAAGTVNMRARLSGQPDKPTIAMNLTVDKGRWKSFELSKVDFKAGYENGTLSLKGTVRDDKQGDVELNGSVPADLSLRPAGFQLPHKGLDAKITATNIDLSFLPKFSPAIEQMEATTNLNLALSGDPYEPSIQGKIGLEGKEIRVGAVPQPIRDLALSASFDRKEFRLAKLDLKVGAQGSVSADGTAKLKGFKPTDLNMSLSAHEFPLGTEEQVSGYTTLDLKAQGPLSNLQVTGDLAVEDAQGKTAWKTDRRLSVLVKSDGLDIQSLSLANNKQHISASGSLEKSGRNDLQINISALDVGQTLALAGARNPPTGTLNADLSLRGTGAEPVVDARIKADQVTWAPLEPVSLALNMGYRDRQASLDATLAPGGGGDLSIKGTLPMELSLTGGHIPASGMDIKVKGEKVNLAFLAMLTTQINSLKATMDIQADIRGNPLKPEPEGFVAVKADRADLRIFGKPLTAFAMRVSFDRARVELTEMKGSVGAGSIDVSGSVDLEELTPTNVRVKLVAKRVPINYQNAVRVTIDSGMQVSGPMMGLNIKGDVNIIEGVVYIDRFSSVTGAEGVIVVQTEEDLKALENKSEQPSEMYRNMVMSIGVKGQRDLWARGAGANVEARTGLNVLKDAGEDIRITGQISVIRGFFDYSGKSFKIDKGTVTFTGAQKPDPLLDITAIYEVSKTKIYINVTGSASKPALILTSDPSMDQSDILAYLLFGSSVNSLSGSNSNQLQSMAGSFLGGMVSDTLKGILGKEFALDVFQFQGGGGDVEGSALTVGKYIAPRIFVTFKHGFAQNQSDQLQVQYEISDSLSIESQIGSEQNTGADITWTYEW